MPSTPHAYGWRPSLPDIRDIPADTTGLEIADSVDPRPQMPPVYDQGQLGSCTANAVSAALEYDAVLSGHDLGTPSRLFLYYEERAREGSTASDAGAFGRDGFKVAKHEGVPQESVWPYDIAKFAERPPQYAYDVTLRYKIDRFAHVRRAEDAWKQVLSNQQTIAFGFTVYESFESAATADSGVVPMPQPGERVLGGHEVLAIGYLPDHPDHLLARNSWGAAWGLSGYFLMPWAYVMNEQLASDFRTIPRAAPA